MFFKLLFQAFLQGCGHNMGTSAKGCEKYLVVGQAMGEKVLCCFFVGFLLAKFTLV